jgi:hypothetical protein
MRVSHFAGVVLLALTLSVHGATTVPELEAGRAKYQEALANIRVQRDREAAPFTKTYGQNLQKLYDKFIGEGEGEAAAAVKEEQERVARGAEPTNEERRKMQGLLLASRVAYEKARGMSYIAASQLEVQAHASWSAGLAQLKAFFAKQGQAEKAAVVQAELDKLAKPVVPVIPATPAGPKLDDHLADKIKAAIAAGTTALTPASREKEAKDKPTEVPGEGAVLIGFELSEFAWRGKSVKCLEPIYLGRDGVFHGMSRGKHSRDRQTVQAADGFAVAGVNVQSHDRIGAFQVVFMKLNPATGTLDPATAYASKWYGKQIDGDPVKLGGDGKLVVGVHGAKGADTDTIGLVQLP